jgi:hypothetical protein
MNAPVTLQFEKEELIGLDVSSILLDLSGFCTLVWNARRTDSSSPGFHQHLGTCGQRKCIRANQRAFVRGYSLSGF